LLGAFIYYQLQAPAKALRFKAWVLKNHIFELDNLNSDDYIKIFDKISDSKKKQIFVSMQFCEATKPNFEAIKAAISDVNRDCGQEFELNEIRIDQFNTGYSYSINDEILKFIEDSGYLIADLTCGNKNVYHEIGYLMGLNQGAGAKQDNFLLVHNSQMGDVAQDFGFNLVDIKQLRVSDTNELREQLKIQIKAYYGL